MILENLNTFFDISSQQIAVCPQIIAVPPLLRQGLSILLKLPVSSNPLASSCPASRLLASLAPYPPYGTTLSVSQTVPGQYFSNCLAYVNAKPLFLSLL